MSLVPVLEKTLKHFGFVLKQCSYFEVLLISWRACSRVNRVVYFHLFGDLHYAISGHLEKKIPKFNLRFYSDHL